MVIFMRIPVAGAIAFFITIFLIWAFRPLLVKAKLGQRILEIGPNWHKSKEGTPLMGGIFFGFAIILSTVVVLLSDILLGTQKKLLICLAFIFLHSTIGFIDDYIKMFKKRNKGLSAATKLVLQFAVTAGFLAALGVMGLNTTQLYVPGIDVYIELGIMYYVIMLLLIVYIINCANLTDGIDGLAGSVSLIIMVLFVLLSLIVPDNLTAQKLLADSDTAAVLAGAAVGALLGFLVFNFHPARIFMGDTGSLFLGALAVAMTFMFNMPLLIIPISAIYIIEGLSVILQVISYKTTGKRIFKMSPIHHHFEKCGWGEVKIVGVFTFITALFCALGYYLYTTIWY